MVTREKSGRGDEVVDGEVGQRREGGGEVVLSWGGLGVRRLPNDEVKGKGPAFLMFLTPNLSINRRKSPKRVIIYTIIWLKRTIRPQNAIFHGFWLQRELFGLFFPAYRQVWGGEGGVDHVSRPLGCVSLDFKLYLTWISCFGLFWT